MSLAEDTQVYGRKPAVLQHIKEELPTIPIEPFVAIAQGEDWKQYLEAITALGPCIVRSASSVEGGRYGFSGLMRSEPFFGKDAVQAVIDSFTSDQVLMYAQHHGVATPIPVRYFFHKISQSNAHWTMLRHPHIPSRLFISEIPGTYGSTGRDFVYDQGRLSYTRDLGIDHIDSADVKFQNEFTQAIAAFEAIEGLPAFNTEYVYAMEFGTSPLSIYQFTEFRLKLQVERFVEPNFFTCPIVFGVTSPKGIELPIVRVLGSRLVEDKFEETQQLKHFPLEIRVTSLCNTWDINDLERPYAEEVALSQHPFRDYRDHETFHRAIYRIAQASVKPFALFEEDIHNGGKEIDLIVPEAAAWIAGVAHDFLSHHLFRAAQHYPLAVLGDISVHPQTGERVRITSDGANAKIERA